MKLIALSVLFLLALGSAITVKTLAMDKQHTDQFDRQRHAMVETIRMLVKETEDYTRHSRLDERTLAALEKVPRHRFVPEQLRHLAYSDSPLPIGHSQTISQPYIVALMTDLIEPKKNFRVLEIGTGSGYQAAVLAQLVDHVYTIEIIDALAESAADLLKTLGYMNITVRAGDGYKGWPEQAPFDAIVVTAGGNIPKALIQQLKPGGRMVIPVENARGAQHLTVISKDHEGEIHSQQILPVRFVPLVGGED